MSTAFLCGYIEEDYFSHYNITKFISIVKSIIEENNIDKIYHCKRTYFDVKFCDMVKVLKFDGIEIIELRDIHKKDSDYIFKQHNRAYKPFCPFENEIENNRLYQTLYDWAIDNSDCLITYSKFDDDISQRIIKKTSAKGKKVINIAELI